MRAVPIPVTDEIVLINVSPLRVHGCDDVLGAEQHHRAA
jgi:hypothetical protein